MLDDGAGQGTQSLRLAHAGHHVLAVEPDPEMRMIFASRLEQEARHIQARVDLVADGGEGLSQSAGDRRFDIVLLLGVLMYLPTTEPVIAELARHTRPGGIAALAIRTTTSALWRPAARQDGVAARAAFEEADRAKGEHRDAAYVNELGARTRAVDLDELVASAGTHGLKLEQWYDVRVAVDPTNSIRPLPTTRGRCQTSSKSRNGSGHRSLPAPWPSSCIAFSGATAAPAPVNKSRPSSTRPVVVSSIR